MAVFEKRPKISIVIICYNMVREVPRTVLSFLSPYQQRVSNDDIEILVVENGSPNPLPDSIISSWPSNVRYHAMKEAHPSPARALNAGIALSRADLVCPVIDGARMASPGLIATAFEILEQNPNAYVASMGCHLGFKLQQLAAQEGYNQSVEDKLLDEVDWINNGYRLFEIACSAGSAKSAWLGLLSESNAPIMRREFYETLGGYDERFDLPGGGLVNLDFFKRCASNSKLNYYLIFGEATFHQYHGGVSTSKPVRDPAADGGPSKWDIYHDQYKKIAGMPWTKPQERPILYGRSNNSVELFIRRAMSAGPK